MTEERRISDWLLSIVSNGRWYLLSSVTTKVLALLTLTILTHSLSPAEFGVLNALIALTQMLPIVLSLYLDSAVARLYHDYQKDQRQLAALFSTVFWFVLAWGGASLLVLSLVADRLPMNAVSVPLAFLWIAAVPTLLLQIAQLGMMFLRQSFESRAVTRIEVWGALIGVAATYLLVVMGGTGVLGRLWAIALASAYAFAYVIWHFTRAGLLVFQFDRRKLKECLKYSLPLLPNLVAGWIAGTSDRLIIAKYVDLQAVGIYSGRLNRITALRGTGRGYAGHGREDPGGNGDGSKVDATHDRRAVHRHVGRHAVRELLCCRLFGAGGATIYG